MYHLLGLILIFVILLIIFWGIQYGVYFLRWGTLKGMKQRWVTKHFKDNSNADLKRVAALIGSGGQPPGDFTAWELVVVYCFFLSEIPVPETLQRAISYGHQGWDKKYDYDFYSALDQTALRVLWKRGEKTSMRLLQFGQGLARHFNDRYWENHFRERIGQAIKLKNKLDWDASRRIRP